MANEWAALAPPKPKRRWPRRLAWIFGGFCVFLVVTYLVVTSFTFLKIFVLPKVRSSLNGPVEVADARISVFFGITLRGVKVGGTPFEEPLATIREIRVRHALLDILRGNIHVKEVLLDAPVIQLIEYEDGTSNLSHLLKPSSSSSPEPAATPSKPGSAPQVYLEKLGLSNAVVRYIRQRAGGAKDTVEVQNLNLSVANVGNGRTGNLRLGVDLKVDQAAGATGTNAPGGVLQATLAAGFEFGLSGQLLPENARGNLTVTVGQAMQAFAELKEMGLALDCDLTPTDLKQLSLTFSKAGTALGRLAVSGPLNVAQQEGDLRIELSSIDRRLLNLVAAPFGLDFGSTQVGSAHHVVLTGGGQSVRATGDLKIHELSVAQKGMATKPLDLQLDYDVSLNRAEHWLLVQRFALTGTQNQAPFLSGVLPEPMKLSLAGGTNSVPDTAFHLTVTNLHLADWQVFLGDCRGSVGVTLDASAQQGGQKLSLDLGVTGEDLAVAAGSNAPPRADAVVRLRARLDGQRRVQVEECRVELSDRRQPLATVAATGSYDLSSQAADGRSQVDIALPATARWLGRPEFEISAGSLKLEAQAKQENLTPDRTNQPSLKQSANAKFRLDGLSGRMLDYRLDRLEVGFDVEAGMQEQRAELRRFVGFFKHAGLDGGAFEIAGTARLADKIVDGSIKVTDLNQNLLRPFLAPALGSNQLQNVSIGLVANAQSSGSNACALTAQLKMADLLITDPAGQLPKVPLTAELKLSGTLRDDLAEIREVVATLRQGEVVGGNFQAHGRYDLKGQAGALTCKLVDLNQNALRPLLASALGDKVLDSISIGLDAEAAYQAKGESSVRAEFRLGHLVVRDPVGQIPASPIDLDLGLNATLQGDTASVRRLAAQFKLGDQPAGSLQVTAGYDLKTKSVTATVKLTDVNENALRPFVTNGIAGKKLSSISISADLNAGYDAAGKATVNGDLGVSKLVLQDPQARQAASPLGADVHTSVTFAKQVLTLDDLQIKLSATARAKNALSLTGRVDLSRSNQLAGELQLTAESLDLTPYYEAFQSSPNAAKTPVTAPKEKGAARPAATAPKSNTEPEAVRLPIDQFLVGLKVGQFYLGDVSGRDWQTTVKLTASRVILNPMQMVLNGAPVNVTADVELGVPGFRYDVNALMDQVPVAPLVDTFAPDMRGLYKGNLLVNSQVKGAGVTGTNLRKNLSGHAAVGFTNADFKIASPKLKAFFLPIGVVLGMPDMLNSPVSSVGASTELGGGRIHVSGLNLVSDSFLADTAGDIAIADVITDSPIEKLPMHFSIRREAADRLRLTPKNTSADAAYARLPDFIKIAGTLGEPKAEMNKSALGSAVAEKLFDKAVGGRTTPSVSNPFNPLK